ncbi:hypothetical protein GCM10010254_10270 [Streptomyces chromofuscus]|nr:hypothetical protein GCM10010254_10270 [Streptomyces chromofuscus]
MANNSETTSSTASGSLPLVSELLSAVTDSGWPTRSTGSAGRGPVASDAGLGDIAAAFRAHSLSAAWPPSPTSSPEPPTLRIGRTAWSPEAIR